jgi:hypothetical protein
VRGVQRGPERRPVDPASLRHLPAEGGWAFDCQGGEFVVGGGPDHPDPARFDVAQFVAARIDEFVGEANGYLAAFVVPERFEACGPWALHGVEFGRDPADPTDMFEVLLVLDGDTYGLWGVRFQFSGTPLDRFYPVQFSRRQW